MKHKPSKPNFQLLARRPISEVKLRDAESRGGALFGADWGIGAFGIIASLAASIRRRKGAKPWSLGK